MILEAGAENNYPKNGVWLQDLRVVAACVVCGIPLEDGYGISNQYSRDRKYERGEPGSVYYFLKWDAAISPMSVAKVWNDPAPDVEECRMIPLRLRTTREIDAWKKLAQDIDALHVWCAVANMRAFSDGKFSVGMLAVTDEEREAAQWVSDLPARMSKLVTVGDEGRKLAEEIVPRWDRAMVAWVKAWAAQYMEIRKAWLAANPKLRIDRGENTLPIIIPKGPQFRELLRRWG